MEEFFLRRKTISPMAIIKGKAVAANSPDLRPICSRFKLLADQKFRLFLALTTESEIKPAIQGPREQPRSPKIARMPNIMVPPLGKAELVRLKVPGHIKLTDRPHRPQASKDSMG
jgi:hypothetical protein